MRKIITVSRTFIKDNAIIFYLALFKLAIHLVFYTEYGYFRDEFYYIACSDHLAFGYVDQPPLSIFLLAVGRLLLGDSLFVLRFIPALAGATVVFMTGLLVRQLGGGKFSQFLAGLAVIVAPVILGLNRFYSMNAFDLLFWVIAAYVIVTIIQVQNSKRWLVFGIIFGFGLLNKYSMGFFCIGLVAGLLFTSHRKYLISKWFWLGALIAFGIFLPHLLWEIKYGFPSIEFMRNASLYKNVATSPIAFLMGQFLEIGFGNALLWLPGLFYCFFHKEGKQYRLFGWMYLIIFTLMVATNAKVYYLSPIYPLLLAMGSVAVGKFTLRFKLSWFKSIIVFIVVLSGLFTMPFAIPVLSVEAFIKYQNFLGLSPPQEERKEMGELPQHYADMFGWEEMVATVARVYQALTPEEQSKCIIVVWNYGQAGAIDVLGRKYSLPKATCGHNNYWFWGPPHERTGEVAIIYGTSSDVQKSYEAVSPYFEEVVHAATHTCQYCMPYENNRPIFICRNMKGTIQEIWPELRHYD